MQFANRFFLFLQKNIMRKGLFFDILFHLIFWLISSYIFISFNFIRLPLINVEEEYISLAILLIIIYINFFFLTPSYLFKGKIFSYILFIFSLLIFATGLEFKLSIDDIIKLVQSETKKGLIDAFRWNFFGILFRDTLFVGFFTMFRIYQDAVKSYKLLQKNTELEKQYFLSQMDTIKSKVNTHFFFNTLDSIYSLIITKSSKASETVLNLSDLMRYVVGESDKKWVSLEKEINFLQNYIELEKVKDSSTNLSLEITGNTNEYEVPPMIFESFVNNAFKYTDFRNNGFISIKITCESGIIFFNCKNSINYDESDKKIRSTKKGLINTRNRLDLIYNENYKLDIKEDDGYFSVNLMLKKQ